MKMEMKMKTVFKSEQKISHSVKVISQVNVYNVTFSWDDDIEIWDFLFSCSLKSFENMKKMFYKKKFLTIWISIWCSLNRRMNWNPLNYQVSYNWT